MSYRLLPSALTRQQLFLVTAAWIASVPNASTVKQFFDSPAAGDGLAAVVFAVGGWLIVLTVTLLLLLVCGVFFWGRSAKALCAVMLVAGAVLGYFSTELGTQFDKTMFINILQTHTEEAAELLSFRMLVWILLAAAMPVAILWFIPLRAPSSRFGVAWRSALMLASLAVLTSAVVYAQYSQYATAVRNHHVTFYTVAPANVLAAAIAYGAARYASTAERAPRGMDARQGYKIAKPRLLIFVLGETARAQNQGLNGYERDTTPRMRAAKGYYFPNAESCGTATAISLPCMFSGFSRKDFSLRRGLVNETLIDVVIRSGARVLWLDNDSGCKGVCDSAEFQDFTKSRDGKWCPERGNCFDEILLDGLEQKIRVERRDTLVVLHLKGSHGPAYYRRYPPSFERFTPACRSSDLSSCDETSIRNAYDNTILYTDHVVGEIIKLLQGLADQYATALLYVSDHGESLGESGLYLHGMPFMVAPKEQTRVPLFAWVSPQFLKLERWDPACMAKQTEVPRSHDNVYATVLGFLEIESVEYKPALDLFEPCDPPRGK